MDNITTNAIDATTVVTETTKQYNEKGFEGAIAYLALIAMIVIGMGIIWYIRRTINNNDKLQDKLLEMFKSSVNEKIDDNNKLISDMLNEIKSIITIIKDGVATMVETCNKNNDMIFKLIESNNDKMLGTINSEKEVSIDRFEKESKIIIEIYLLRLKESLQDRIEKNSLFQSQSKILGTVDKQRKDGELYEEIKRNVIMSKSEIDEEIDFKNKKAKEILFENYDIITNELIEDICKSFTVTIEKYSKSDIHRDVRRSISSALNKIAEINLTNLLTR